LKIKTNILLIGGCISGLSLAIKLAKIIPDQEIVLITKGNLKEFNTFHAQGGIVKNGCL